MKITEYGFYLAMIAFALGAVSVVHLKPPQVQLLEAGKVGQVLEVGDNSAFLRWK